MKYIKHFVNTIRSIYACICKYIQTGLNFISSLIFNFTYLPFAQAVKMPIWVENISFPFRGYSGKILIESDMIRYKMIRLGHRYNSWYPFSGFRLQLRGTIIFHGEATIGNNSTIYVGNGSILNVGDGVYMAASTKIICQSGIDIKANVLIGWNSQISDTDFHALIDLVSGKITKIKSPVVLEEGVWLGNNVIVSKGTKLAKNTIVSSGSVVNGRFKEENVILKGNPAVKVSEGYQLAEKYKL